MDNNITRKKVFASLGWKYLERGSVQGISFIISIILARLLVPDDYGTIVLITVFISVANVFVQSGFNMALIQRKDIKEEDYSSVFVVSLAIATIIYILLFIGAPSIAKFYGKVELIKILRVQSFTLFFGAVNSIQSAILISKMNFRQLFLNSLWAVIGSGIIGIGMAYMGFGVWALIGQQLSNSILICFIMWFTVKWRPKLIISWKRIKILFSFGWKVLVSSLIDTFYNELYNLVIGKIYSPSTLAYYNKGREFPQFIVVNIDSSIESVMLPTYAAYQEDKDKVKQLVRRAIIMSSFIVFPILVGLGCTAELIVKIILTDKWLAIVPFIQIYCAALFFHPINMANTQAINALGRSDIYLKINIWKKIIALIILGISLKFGVYGIALGSVISGLVFVILNIFPNIKLLNYGLREQFRDVFPAFSISVAMGIVIYCLKVINIGIWGTLILKVLIGIIVYVVLGWIFRLEAYTYIIDIIKEILKKNSKTNRG